jgi:UDP-2,3-diacylglucosamine pyrophosphatase LpxH
MNRHYRTLWISDTHLGTKGCRARELSRFLKHIRCQRLYLVGDIIDIQRLRQRWYWPQAHNDVVRRILTHAQHGTEVIFVPGNHDDAARQYLCLQFGGVVVRPWADHQTADGRWLYVCHGDQYDLIVRGSLVLAALGGLAYEWLLTLNRTYNAVRQWLGRSYLSLS